MAGGPITQLRGEQDIVGGLQLKGVTSAGSWARGHSRNALSPHSPIDDGPGRGRPAFYPAQLRLRLRLHAGEAQ